MACWFLVTEGFKNSAIGHLDDSAVAYVCVKSRKKEDTIIRGEKISHWKMHYQYPKNAKFAGMKI